MTPHKKPRIICRCLHVDEEEILAAFAKRHVRSLKDIIRYTSAGDGCTACHPDLLEYLQRRRAAKR